MHVLVGGGMNLKQLQKFNSAKIPATIVIICLGLSTNLACFPKNNSTQAGQIKQDTPAAISPHTSDELGKNAIIIAKRYLQLFVDHQKGSIADDLKKEIANLEKNITDPISTPKFAVGFFPAIQFNEPNPYLDSVYKSVDTYLKNDGDCFPFSTEEKSIFPKTTFMNARKVADELEQLYFLINHPSSRYRFNPQLVQQFFCRIYATSYDYFLHGGTNLTIPGSTPNALDDWFATGPVIYAWAMANESFGHLIPNTFKKFMKDSALRAANAIMLISTTPRYANRDISYAEILLQAGRFLNDQQLLGKAHNLLSQTCDSIFPDGAFPYIWDQNECVNYHAGNIRSIARIYAMTGDDEAKNCLIKSKDYEAITIEPGNVSEFYTTPAWKTMWNTGHGIDGAEPVASLGRQGVLRTMINQQNASAGAAASVLFASFYDHGLAAAPIPDQYIVIDRNIQGVRGRFGDFSYGFTGRNVNSERVNDPGLITHAGAMTTQAKSKSPDLRLLNSALMAVYPKVQIKAMRDGQEWNSWAYLRSGTQSVSLVAKGAAAFGASNRLQIQTTQARAETDNTGPGGQEVPWTSAEVWLALDDRIIGLIETNAESPSKALQVNGRIKLGYGRSGDRVPQELQVLRAGKEYRYGQLLVRLHEHNYQRVSEAKAGVVRDNPPLDAREIVLSDQQMADNATMHNYLPQDVRYFVVEIAREGAAPLDLVNILKDNHLRTLIVQKGQKIYQATFNKGIDNASVAIDERINSRQAKILLTKNTQSPPSEYPPGDLVLPPRAILLAIVSPDSKDATIGWQTFSEMLEAR